MTLSLLPSCNPEAPYHTEDVSLKLEVKRVSAGFAEVHFTTDKDAYYFADIEPVREGIDPKELEFQFKSLALDHAYVEYVNWRYEHLYKGEELVAEFSSHSLQYGEIFHGPHSRHGLLGIRLRGGPRVQQALR